MKSARDYTPSSWKRLVTIRERLERFLDRRGYEVVATPILEHTELFLRKSGGELAARMYSFTDPSGRRVSLRPEFTSSVVRSYIDGTLKGPSPLRWQYCGTVFRYEGEQRDGGAGPRSSDVPGSLEFQQLGAELIGVGSVEADAEVLATAVQGLTALGVVGHRLRVGHMGVVNAMLDGLGLSERARVFILGSFGTLREPDGMDRVRSRATDLGLLGEERTRSLSLLTRRMDSSDAEGMVEGFLAPGVGDVGGQRTPEEVFQRYLKKLREAGVPEIIEKSLKFSAELVALSGPADKVRGKLTKLVDRYGIDADVLSPLNELLDALALYDLKDVPVLLDLGMARGIAYYTGVVFDLDHPKIKDNPNLGGGGRYDGLVKALGGVKDVPALGYAYTVDRISELLPSEFGSDETDGSVRVLVTAQGASLKEAVATAERLRVQGIPAELDLQSRTDADAAKYAKQRGIQTIMRVGPDGSVAEHST
ncbi:MAG: HisS family protein [Dehalococcoidia bacterium]